MRQMYAAELMTPDPIVVEAGTPIAEVARRLREHNIGSVPVVGDLHDKRLHGIITDRDIAVRCTAEGHDPRACPVERHMTGEVASARAGDDIGQIMEVMRGAQVRRVPVLDASQRVIGIVAQADLAVDAVDEDAASPLDVAYTLERVSQPAHPERSTMH